MASIFARIVAGEIPAIKVYEDDETLAFMDINPATPGHTLVVLKQELPGLLDLPPELLVKIMLTTQRVARAIVATLKPHGFNIIQNNGRAAGQTVFHYHIHIIPRWDNDNALPLWEPNKPDREVLLSMAAAISAAIAEE